MSCRERSKVPSVIDGIAKVLTEIEEPELAVQPTLAMLLQGGKMEPAMLTWPSCGTVELRWAGRAESGCRSGCAHSWPDLEPYIPEQAWRDVIGDDAVHLECIALEEERRGLRAVCNGRHMADYAYGPTGWRVHRPGEQGVIEDLRAAGIIAGTSVDEVRAWDGSYLRLQDLCVLMCAGNYVHARRVIWDIEGDDEWVISVLGRATEMIEDAEERAIALLDAISDAALRLECPHIAIALREMEHDAFGDQPGRPREIVVADGILKVWGEHTPPWEPWEAEASCLSGLQAEIHRWCGGWAIWLDDVYVEIDVDEIATGVGAA